MINNYRVNFGGEDIDYKDNFKDCRQYFPVLKKLYEVLRDYRIEDAWHFFEPFVELTWVVPQSMIDEVIPLKSREPITRAEDALEAVLYILKQEGIEPTLIHRPEDGVIVDWYNKNPEEQIFGYQTYAISAKMAMLFWEYREAIENGCGEKNQFMRRPHVLANQIGMNYEEESVALFQRSTLARMFWETGDQAEGVKQYEEKFGEKYL